MPTQTIDVPLYSPGPPSSSDLQREKMNLTVGSIGSHSFVGAAASHNGTIRCEWKCKVCVYILAESSGLVLIRRCRFLDWRLSVQRSAKGQTPAKKKTKIICSDQAGLFLCILTVHGCNLTSLMQLEQIPRKIVCRCVQVCVYIYICIRIYKQATNRRVLLTHFMCLLWCERLNMDDRVQLYFLC